MNRPAMPRRIKVLGQTFTITKGEGLMVHVHGKAEAEPVEILGVMDDTTQAIALEKNQADGRMQITYLHESLHAMFSLAGMQDAVDFDTEERVVGRLAPILLLFLKENPSVYTYLTGRYTYR